MKKLFSISLALVAMLAVVFTVSSCTKDNVNVILSLSSKQICINTNPFQGYQEEDFDIMRSELQSAFSAVGQTFDLSKIESVKLLEGNLVLASSGNVDDLSNVEVYIRPYGATGDGQQVAYSNTIGTGVTTISFQFNGTDLSTMFKENDHLVLKVKILNKLTGNSAKCLDLTSAKFSVSVKQ